MAKENKEIGDIVKKCKILLLDIEGTTTSISFVKDKLFPYAEENVKQFLDSQWETEDVKDVVAALRKLAIEDQAGSVEGVVTIPGEDASKEEQIEGLVSSVKWQMSADRKAGPLKQLQGLIWKQGYDKGDIKGHVYDDVSAALDAWQAVDGQKVYIYSSGSVQAQKLLFGQSLAGDLLKYIEGHFDTAVGAKQEAASYKNIVEKIGCNPEDILFLTDILKEAEAAREAGLQAALVSREGNASLPAEASSFPVLHSLAELTVSNKRKPEPQESETPAKIPKTEVKDDLKTTSETVSPAATAAVEEKEPEPEKMEVEDNGTSNEKPIDVPMKEQITVEELDSNEATSVVSVCDLEPVVEESTEEKEEKTEEKPEEKTETKKTMTNGKGVDAPVPEETPPSSVAIVTEIEEVEPEKPLSYASEVIEDIVPVVEEPDAGEDMEELQNVGEVLEKECDEILSKVNNVTNLNNIPSNAGKPHLNTIAEETMETDNTDTSDIVEGILDSELENEMKQCADIDLNTVTEITEPEKANVVEENGVKEASPEDTKNDPEEMVIENKVEVKSVKDEKAADCKVEKGTESKVEKDPENKIEKVVESLAEKVTESTEEKATENTEEKGTENTDEKVAENTVEKVVTSPVEKMEESNEEKVTEIPVEKVAETPVDVTESTFKKNTEKTEEKVAETTPMDTEAEPEANNVEEAKSMETESKESVDEKSTEAEKPAESKDKEEEKKAETVTEEIKSVSEAKESEKVIEKTDETKKPEPTKDEAQPEEEVKAAELTPQETTDTEVKEPQLNGNATNGSTDKVMNGDASKDEELNARLSVENGKVNGSNGDSMDGEKGQGDCKAEAEVTDIKVKTVTTDEPRTDPIEQPTEA